MKTVLVVSGSDSLSILESIGLIFVKISRGIIIPACDSEVSSLTVIDSEVRPFSSDETTASTELRLYVLHPMRHL